jgi:hypothetical protein
MLHLTELCCTSHSHTALHSATLYPTELSNTLWTMLHPSELTNTLWATLHPTKLCCTPLSFAVPYPTELPNNLWAVLHPTELRCTPLSYGAQTLRNEMMNDNLTRKYPWCLLVRTYKLSLIWVVRQTIRNEKMDVYLWKYPWSEVLDKLYYMLDST